MCVSFRGKTVEWKHNKEWLREGAGPASGV